MRTPRKIFINGRPIGAPKRALPVTDSVEVEDTQIVEIKTAPVDIEEVNEVDEVHKGNEHTPMGTPDDVDSGKLPEGFIAAAVTAVKRGRGRPKKKA